MSRLIFKGDTIKNFGELLPTPFIERIYVDEDTIDIDLSLFILVNEDESDQTELLTRLNDITSYIYLQPYFSEQSLLESLLGSSGTYDSPVDLILSKQDSILKYMAFALGNSAMTGLEEFVANSLSSYLDSKTGGLTSFDDIYDEASGTTVYEYIDSGDGDGDGVAEASAFGDNSNEIYTPNYYCPDGDCDDPTTALTEWATAYLTGLMSYLISSAGLFIEPQDVTWESTGETKFDADGNLVLKLAATTVQFSFPDSEMLAEAVEADMLGGEGWNLYDQVAVFAFSSTVDLGLDGDGEEIEELLENNVLTDMVLSDISYEMIIEDNAIVDPAEQVWVDSSGNPFSGVPLQEIMQTYHKPTSITHNDIVKGFQELISKFENQTLTDSTLESVVDGVSYVLATYENEPDLVPQLNKLRKAWPDKSSITPTGKLYHAFKRALFNASKTVGRDPVLTKQMVTNPKVIDRRAPSGEWVPHEIWLYDGEYYTDVELEEQGITEAIAEQYSPLDPEDEDNMPEFIYPNWLVSAQTFFTSDQEEDDVEGMAADPAEGIKINGYIFLDLEKFIIRASNISNIYDTRKLDEYFGKGLINSCISDVSNCTLKRYDGDPDDEDSELVQYLNASNNAEPETEESETIGSFSTPTMTTIDGEDLYSYLVLRNFEFPSSDGSESNYRLMCFEFQDLDDAPEDIDATYIDDASSPDWYYSFGATIQDDTIEIYDALKRNYEYCLTGSFQEYYDVATEACNFNESAGTFNEFFVDAITTAFEDMPGETPWVRAPFLFHLHRDLLYDAFDGDYDRIVVAAKSTSDSISPYAGTLTALDVFATSFQALWDDHYSATGVVDDWSDALSIGQGTHVMFSVFGGDSFPYIYDISDYSSDDPYYSVDLNWVQISIEEEAITGTVIQGTLMTNILLMRVYLGLTAGDDSYDFVIKPVFDELIEACIDQAAISAEDDIEDIVEEVHAAIIEDYFENRNGDRSDISSIGTASWVTEHMANEDVAVSSSEARDILEYWESSDGANDLVDFKLALLEAVMLVWVNYAGVDSSYDGDLGGYVEAGLDEAQSIFS